MCQHRGLAHLVAGEMWEQQRLRERGLLDVSRAELWVALHASVTLRCSKRESPVLSSSDRSVVLGIHASAAPVFDPYPHHIMLHTHARTRTLSPSILPPPHPSTVCLPVLPAIKSARGPNRSYMQSRGEPSLVQPSPAPVQGRVKGGMGQQLAAPSGEADYAMQAGADRSQLQSRGSTREAAMPKVPEENAAE